MYGQGQTAEPGRYIGSRESAPTPPPTSIQRSLEGAWERLIGRVTHLEVLNSRIETCSQQPIGVAESKNPEKLPTLAEMPFAIHALIERIETLTLSIEAKLF
jgi:hypothetical protein